MQSNLDSLRLRVKKLNTISATADHLSILYVMSRDCRVQANHALLAAQQHAMKAQLPLVVAYVVYDKQLDNRAREHITFLLDGLQDVERQLQKKNIPFILRCGANDASWAQLLAECDPAAVYFDFSPLRSGRRMKQKFAATVEVPVFVVDTHNVVPVWVASGKQEVGARTLRPKIHHYLPDYLHDDMKVLIQNMKVAPILTSESFESIRERVIPLYPSNKTDVSRFKPGETAAQSALDDFIKTRLRGYAVNRNNPTIDAVSELSPYLHFGQISSLQVAIAAYNEIKRDSSIQPDVDTLLEEMIVRKELSDNFCFYNDQYDSISGAPEWAQKTLAKHTSDHREFTYTTQQFESAQTHDEAWNAAQLQLLGTGKIHGYMRMYWAKKVLEWSVSPDEALKTLLFLNDFYHIDGGDPNGYVGILWSIAGVHDRPWGERPVYGVIRSMVYNGLKRKFDIKAYIDKYKVTV